MFFKRIFKVAATLAVVGLAITSTVSTPSALAKSHATQPQKERVAIVKTMQIGEHNISYTVQNPADLKKKADRTILLVHGASANSLSTDTLAAELGKRFVNSQIVQVDLPAHGKSTGPVVQSVYGMADVVEEFLKQGQASGEFSKRILPVGISMGGSVVQTLIFNQIKGLDTAVLISTSPEWSHFGPMLGLTGDQFNAMYPGMIEADYAVNTTPEQQAAFHDWFPLLIPAKETSLGDIKALVDFNLVGKLNEFKAKTLIIHGDADATAPIANAQLMASQIKNSKLITIAGETHTYSMKQPATVAQYIYDFVN